MQGSIGALVMLLLALGAAGAATGNSVVLGDEERAQLVALESIRGDSLRSADLRDRAIVVTFFASWCPPCRAEFLHLNRIADEFEASELAIVAVNVYEEFDQHDEVRLSRFLDDTQPRFYVIKGDESIKRTFGDVQRIPTVFVFDRVGQPVMHFIHARGATKMSVTEDELRIAVSRALSR